MRFIRTVVAALVAAALGALLGRVVAGLRSEAQGGEPMAFDSASLAPAPQELVPGLVAALRVQDQPWAALHIPPWLAAFVVNFALSALGRELGPILRTFGMGGDEDDDEPRWRRGGLWTVESTARESGAAAADPHAAASTGESPPYPGFRPFSSEH